MMENRNRLHKAAIYGIHAQHIFWIIKNIKCVVGQKKWRVYRLVIQRLRENISPYINFSIDSRLIF